MSLNIYLDDCAYAKALVQLLQAAGHRVVTRFRIVPPPGLTELRMANAEISPRLQLWITARRRHKLSHAQVQMARELGLNPRKLGKLDNHKQEPWKLPLPQYIEELYLRRFGKAAPDEVVCIEELARRAAEKKAKRKAARAARNPTGEPPEQRT